MSCQCHGKGVLEVKCPYCHRDDTIEYAVRKDAKFCLQKHDDGSMHLDHGHAYYYQVQTQLFVCEADFCDFCEMIGCDNPDCSIQSFHMKCLKLKVIPEGNWYCPDCTHSK